jgi:hypothetical protein
LALMSSSIKNGIIWVGLSIPQGDKGGEVDKNSNRVELINNLISSRISLQMGRFLAK